jgi:hypothetical protein
MKIKTERPSPSIWHQMAFAYIDKAEREMLKHRLLGGKGYIWIHAVTFHYQIADGSNPTAVRGEVTYPLKETIRIEREEEK